MASVTFGLTSVAFDCASENISELNRKTTFDATFLFILRSIEASAVIFVGPAFEVIQGSVGKVQIFYKKDILVTGQFLGSCRKDHEIRKPQFEVPMIDNF